MPGEPAIIVTPNGPYLVSQLALVVLAPRPTDPGEPLTWVSGPTIPTNDRYALCRCGHSGRKPFCDGTHARIAFDGTEVAGADDVEWCPAGVGACRSGVEDAGDEPRSAPHVAVMPDGPLLVTGGVIVTTSDGTPMEARRRVTLCRCGESKHKPLCDGTHEEVGFRHTPVAPAAGG